MVDDAQLSPRVVAGTQTLTGLKPPTFNSESESANQYNTIALTPSDTYYIFHNSTGCGIVKNIIK